MVADSLYTLNPVGGACGKGNKYITAKTNAVSAHSSLTVFTPAIQAEVHMGFPVPSMSMAQQQSGGTRPATKCFGRIARVT
jgi:hypothetical protein